MTEPCVWDDDDDEPEHDTERCGPPESMPTLPSLPPDPPIPDVLDDPWL